MRYHVLACDYDGTLAYAGRVPAETIAALETVLATGRKLVLVTGRELEDIKRVFPEIKMFTYAIVENGALQYRPATDEIQPLGPPPPEELIRELQRRKVPLSVGRTILATVRPHETAVLQAIRDCSLDWQVIFNKESVMVLPSGINKGTGLKVALAELGMTFHETVGVGDAENDHAFLSRCECAVAVANALGAVKERVDWITVKDHGHGVNELIEQLTGDDLAKLEPRLTRHHLLLGESDKGREVRLPPYGISVLVAGPSGSGKSSAATSLLERLAEQRYQFSIIDPEGDYENLTGAITLGSQEHGPTIEEVLQVLGDPKENVVADLVGLPLNDRPAFLLKLLSRLQEMRAHNGRPHWLLIDEAHHMLPVSWQPTSTLLQSNLKRMLYITVHANELSAAVCDSIDVVIAVGQSPEKTIAHFAKVVKEDAGPLPATELAAGEVLVWWRARKEAERVRLVPSRMERRRHTRKYAEGELPPERSFYFRGPDGKLNLRAQNLILFMQLADGVDDDTWSHHLGQGDYSRWFRDQIKDEELASQVAAIEKQRDISPLQSRAMIREIIEHYYTLPAGLSAPASAAGTS